MRQTRGVHLVSRPQAQPSPDNFKVVERDLYVPKEEEVQVRNLCMSVDPYMTNRLYERTKYVAPYRIGHPLDGGAVGLVEASTVPGF